jgi:hypothetical protein
VDGKICATHNLAEKGKRGSVVRVGVRENACDRDCGEELEKLLKNREF